MGKFAGFLKRAKKIEGFAGGVLNGLNKVYKAVQPFTEDIVGALPFGNYINKGLNTASKVVDKIAPITKNWLDEDDKAKLKKINSNIKRYGGDIAQKALNNYMDTQEELLRRGGDYSLKDYSLKTAGDVAAGLVKRAGKPLFGQPVNKPMNRPREIPPEEYKQWKIIPAKLDEYGHEIDGETPPEYDY